MSRVLSLTALLLLVAVSAAAQGACNLTIDINCPNGNCTSTVRNAGNNLCTGEYLVGIFVENQNNQGSVSGFHQTLGLTQCFDSSSFPGAVAFPFGACFDHGSLGPNTSFTMSAQVNAPSGSQIIAITEVIDENTGNELALAYAINGGGASAPLTCTPTISAPPIVPSDFAYTVSWPAGVVDPRANTYVLEESTSKNFDANVASQTVTGTSAQFTHHVTADTTYYYHVKATTCNGAPGSFSDPEVTVVQAATTLSDTRRNNDVVAPFGSTTPFSFQLTLHGRSTGKQDLGLQSQPISVATDKPYLTVSPSTVPSLPATVTVTASPGGLPPGANTGTVTASQGGSIVSSTSVSVSLVTPVSPSNKTLPPSNALIIPVVTHVNGSGGPFQSDVRLTNSTGASVTYNVTFSPTGKDATQGNSKTTPVTVDSGQTVALNDVVKDFFGLGATSDPSDTGFGSLEIRPTNSSSALSFASSRTFVTTAAGTLGQFVAAVPFTQFATRVSLSPIPTPGGNAIPVLSMQQVSSGSRFHTNLGLVEGSGTPASGNIKVYNDAGQLQATVPYSLLPGEVKQLNGFLANPANVPNLSDGRIEVTVESQTGAVSAYASVLDNVTSDPLAVQPVQVSQISSTRYVLPGMADFDNPGASNFHSDARLYNGGTNPVTVNATFFQINGGPSLNAAPITVAPGEVKAYDNALTTIFGSAAQGKGAGSIVFTTSAPSSLVATGRTYTNDGKGGTYGQFIPGISPSQGIGVGDRPLQILQLEQSSNFRTNLGLVELNGQAAHARLTLILPDSKTAPIVDVDLTPNEYTQFNSIFAAALPGQNIYNARITVEVTSGSGRVSAYGSVIDASTGDPTYVPAQ